MPADASREERLAEMRRRFVARAREQAARLSELRGQLAGGSASEELVRELRLLCHSLHGAAGTFGYGEISAKAGEAEETLDAILKDMVLVSTKASSLLRQIDNVLAEIGKINP